MRREAALTASLLADGDVEEAWADLDEGAPGVLVVARLGVTLDPGAVAARATRIAGHDLGAVVAPSMRRRRDGAVDRAWARARLSGEPALPHVAPPSPRLVVDELKLSRWAAHDLDELAELHAEPETMAPFGGSFTHRRESDQFAERIDDWFDRYGWGLFAVHDEQGRLLGAVGLAPIPPTIHAPFEAEVGWRLRRSAWGRGVATRAALATLAWAASSGGPARICSFTAASNERSQAVMRRIGLHRRAELDFDHPSIAPGDPRRPHVLYATEPADT